jgi:hypothetical protein
MTLMIFTGEQVMKTVNAAIVCALSLLSAGHALAQSDNVVGDSTWASGVFAVSVIWPPILFAVGAIWQPFLFASVIVGFGTWAIRRLYQKEE